MTAKPVPEHIDMRVATDEQLRTFVDAIAAAFPGELTEPRKVLAEVSRRLTELQHRREAEEAGRDAVIEEMAKIFDQFPDDKMYSKQAASRIRARKSLAASPSSPASGVRVKVKPLDWGKTSYGTPEAISVAGVYRINQAMNGGWSVVFGGLHGRALSGPDGRDNFATIGDAKAAAQADYEARILSALGEHP